MTASEHAAPRAARTTPTRAHARTAALLVALASLAGCSAEEGYDPAPVTSPDDPRAGDGPVEGDPNWDPASEDPAAVEAVTARCSVAPRSVASGALTSWSQPDSTGWRGWNGFCGHTAAANLAANVCGVSVCPSAFDRSPCTDVTPGSRPGTVTCMMNRLVPGGCGTWEIRRPGDADDPMTFLQNRVSGAAMCAALITAGDNLHWVTVTDVVRTTRSCNVRFMQYGRYEQTDCGSFRNRWGLNGSGIVGYLLAPYALVCRR